MSEEMTQITETMEDSPKSFMIRNPLNPPIQYLAERYGGKRAKELERFLKFAVVGISGAIIDIGLLFILQATILPPVNELAVALASGIAFFTAVVSNFIWTRLWVYPDSRTRSMRRQLAMFTFVSVIGGAARLIWMASMAFPIGHFVMPFALPFIQIVRPGYVPTQFAEGRIGSLVAQLIAMVVIMLWNFFANRYWTYNDVD